MGATVARHWTGYGADRDAGRTPSVARTARLARAVCTPTNCLSVAAAAFGWLALVAWTGIGPDGWQAQVCHGLDLRPASCAAVSARKDESRITPHMIPAGNPA